MRRARGNRLAPPHGIRRTAGALSIVLAIGWAAALALALADTAPPALDAGTSATPPYLTMQGTLARGD